jgi:Methyltransferase FkbM domain
MSGYNRSQIKSTLRYLVVFFLGVCLDRFYLIPQDATLQWTSTTMAATTMTMASTPAISSQVLHDHNTEELSTATQKGNKDGWRPVHVFYGHILTAPAQESIYSPQARQDEIVLALLGNQEGGRYFIDLASNHAYRLSNTYPLEQQQSPHPKWKGLCMEANPGYWYDLTRYRTCDIVGAVVGGDKTAAATESVDFAFGNVAGNGDRSDRGILGGIVRADFDNKEPVTDTRKVYPVPIAQILTRFSVPHVIDYMSLDAEGAEYFIMKSFPFKTYEIKIITIERPTEALKTLLRSHHYELVGYLTSWGETLWYVQALYLTL